MKKRHIPLLLIAFAVGAFASETDTSEEAARAQEAVAKFGQALKAELMAGMQAGGPLDAIEVCNIRAPSIATSISAEQELRISRVSLKNRNPDNAANEWQKRVLESFEERKKAGEDPMSLTWQEVAEVDSGREFRFMQAIPTAPLCLQCHGGSIAPPVAAKLAELYPEDKATGYQPGDLRGAFVVIRKL